MISDFHQNKDWNWSGIDPARWSRNIWFLISTKTRIETRPLGCRRPAAWTFDFWFPPKQGLKRIVEIRINLAPAEFDFWFPPKQGLKLHSIVAIPLLSSIFDFWFPPKQGLKPETGGITSSVNFNLISDFHQNKDWNVNIPISFILIPSYLISDFHQNKDWNLKPVE